MVSTDRSAVVNSIVVVDCFLVIEAKTRLDSVNGAMEGRVSNDKPRDSEGMREVCFEMTNATRGEPSQVSESSERHARGRRLVREGASTSMNDGAGERGSGEGPRERVERRSGNWGRAGHRRAVIVEKSIYKVNDG